MDSDTTGDRLVLRLMDAPASYARRVLTAMPDATLVFAERHLGAPSDTTSGLAILYVHFGPDRELVAALSAQMPTLVVSENPTTEDALACLDRGADGYLDASLGARALRSALLGVRAGELAYRREVVGAWLRLWRHPRTLGRAVLTSRDRELIEFLARGATDKEIAVAFGLTKSTVQKQVARLRRRIGAKNRAAAVAMRERLGA